MIAIGIPDSLFAEDSDSLRGKTVKTGWIARSCSIFGIERIYIYRDMSGNFEKDYETARLILEYMETPQYLRKRLFPRRPDLEFAGLLPPLRTLPHMVREEPKIEEIREAVLVFQNGQLKADIGSRELAYFSGTGHEGQRMRVKVISLKPLQVIQAKEPKDEYWGYEVRRAPSLSRFLKSADFDLIILTSRLGKDVSQIWQEFCDRCGKASRILICFGSPELGIHELLRQDLSGKPEDFPKSVILNMFPSQKVETVRLDEAILGTLSILNIAIRL